MKAFTEANMAYLEDLSGGDHTLIMEMIQLFLRQTPGYLERLEDHIQEDDWPNTQSMAHHIKPTLAYMGAENMRKSLIRIELLAKEEPVHTEILKSEFAELMERFDVLFKELEEHLSFLTSKM